MNHVRSLFHRTAKLYMFEITNRMRRRTEYGLLSEYQKRVLVNLYMLSMRVFPSTGDIPNAIQRGRLENFFARVIRP
jgi:hypothetical protein